MNRYTRKGKLRILLFGIALFLLNSKTTMADENREGFRAVFDAEYYYNENPDLQPVIGNDAEQLYSHFVTTGAREGRSGNEEFNLQAYVFYNPELLNAFKTDLEAYCRHYEEIGRAENRISYWPEEKRELIGTYSTSYDVNLPRAENIRIAAQRINGIVLQPGEAFSFSNAVLPRTPENGYVMAPAIGRNEYGGGICQVSSTLYAAMCHALLPAAERHPHSSRVSYLPAGLDATISEGRKDLKFVNPYQEPLSISVTVDGGIITASLKLGIETEVTEGQPQQQEIEESNEPVENKASGPAGDRQDL